MYSRKSVVAEKLHAIVVLCVRNSRLKDYFDLWALMREGALDYVIFAGALRPNAER